MEIGVDNMNKIRGKKGARRVEKRTCTKKQTVEKVFIAKYTQCYLDSTNDRQKW
jgi:hypothetical protein